MAVQHNRIEEENEEEIQEEFQESEHDIINDLDVIDTGAEDIIKVVATKLRKGQFCMIKMHPCKITGIKIIKNGKHGPAKAYISGIDILTMKRAETFLPASHEIDVPIIHRQEYEVLYINDKEIQLLGSDGTTRDDVELGDDEISNKIQEAYSNLSNDQEVLKVMVVTFQDISKIIEFRIA